MSLLGKTNNFKILSNVTQEEEEWLLGKERAQQRREEEQKKAAQTIRDEQLKLDNLEEEKELKTEEANLKAKEEALQLKQVEKKSEVQEVDVETLKAAPPQEEVKTQIPVYPKVEQEDNSEIFNKPKEPISQPPISDVNRYVENTPEFANGAPLFKNGKKVPTSIYSERSPIKPVKAKTPSKMDHHEPENLFQPSSYQQELSFKKSKKPSKSKKSFKSRPKTSTKKSSARKAKPSPSQAEQQEAQQKKLRESINKNIQRERSELKQQLDDLREREQELPQDDGYLDDIMQYEEEQWNTIDMRDQMISSLVQQQRIFQTLPAKKSKKASKCKRKVSKGQNYDFQRLKKSIERQNYMKIAKNFDSTLRLDFDEVKTLNHMKSNYNPYPDHNQPLVNKGVRFLTLDHPSFKSPLARKKSKTASLLSQPDGRIFPKIPRISHGSGGKNSRPIFMVRRPLSTKFNPDRKKYLQRNMTKKNISQKARTMSRYKSAGELAFTVKRKRRRPKKMVGYDDVYRNKQLRLKAQRRRLNTKSVSLTLQSVH